jgi:chromate reductase, NAD(P)H dehydrogenase (quinone)
MPSNEILIISGTNRPDANALRVAKVIQNHYRAANLATQLFSLADMPREIFDPTSYATKPASFLPIQQRVLDAAGLHIITPEYNGSFPGVLKYFVDMLKFPESFERKPVAFTGEAAGIWGAFRSVEQLQMIFGYRNAYVFPDRVFIPGINGKLDASGQINDISINDRLRAQAAGFGAFVKSLTTAK